MAEQSIINFYRKGQSHEADEIFIEPENSVARMKESANNQHSDIARFSFLSDDESESDIIARKISTSFVVEIYFEVPNLESSIITAEEFVNKLSGSFAREGKKTLHNDKIDKYEFAISNFVIMCAEGSKKGKITLLIEMAAVLGFTIFAANIDIDALNNSVNIDIDIPINIFIISLENATMEGNNPSPNAGEYHIEKTYESNIVPRDQALETYNKFANELELTTSIEENSLSISRMSRKKADEDFIEAPDNIE